MQFARVALVAALVVLACFGGVSVRASAVDSWASAPAALADAWPQDLAAPAALLNANELEMRHAEFLSALDDSSSSSSSSSTGAAESSSSSSSSSTGSASNGTESSSSTGVESSSSSTGPAAPTFGVAVVLSAYNRNRTNPIERLAEDACEAIFNATGFPAPNTTERINCTSEFVLRGTVIVTPARRRLLQLATDEVQQLRIVFTPANSSDPVASRVAMFFGEQLRCGTNNTCLEAVAAETGFEAVELPAEVLAALIPGSVQVENGMLIIDNPVSRPTVGPDGDSRRTNGGYYFLAAVLALFALIALVYFVLHKAPAAGHTYKDEAAMRRGAGEEVSMAPVAPAAAPASGVVVANDESAPLGGQQQMDYRSVFALKHNVLERKEEAKAEDDEQTHNDVHFILHQ